ncbi:MAG TPA: DedA family protein [Candidatus Gastranaerophilales bacterium]|nr:DedA family protein [Candidatus Gastranaerophilales bacterium]
MSQLDVILLPIINYIEHTITKMGELGIVLLMAIESANIPLPSEAILPFAGYLVSKGVMGFHAASFAGAIGCVVGSIPSYYLGHWGGRPFIKKYGKWFLISNKDLETADKWTEKYGDWAFFICRMLPVVRTFISLPAGILKANFPKFVFFTFLGSLIWSYFLVYVGVKLGEHREQLSDIWHKFDYTIVTVLLALFSVYVYRHIKHLQEDE